MSENNKRERASLLTLLQTYPPISKTQEFQFLTRLPKKNQTLKRSKHHEVHTKSRSPAPLPWQERRVALAVVRKYLFCWKSNVEYHLEADDMCYSILELETNGK